MNPASSRPYTPSVAEADSLSAPGEPRRGDAPSSAVPSPPEGGPARIAHEPGAHEPGAHEPVVRDPGRTSRRAAFGLALGAVVVGVLCLLDSLPVLYALVALAHVAIAVRWRRKARSPTLDEVHVAPTPVGVMALAFLWVLLLFAVFLPSASFRLVACLLFACAAAAWPVAAANVARVRVVRSIEPRARVDVRTVLDVRVVCRSRRSAENIRLEDDLGLGARPASVEVLLDTLRPGSEAVARASVAFGRRGLRRLRAIRISSTYPLGIFAASRETEARAQVLVHPSEGVPTRTLLERLRGHAREPVRSRAVRIGADEFHELREAREGDDPRRIHWRTSARRGAPTTIVRREEPARRVIVALAACRGKDRTADLAFERAVSAAAGILRAAGRMGTDSTLVLAARSTDASAPGIVPVRRGRDLVRALDALALVKADGGRDPRAAFTSGDVDRRGAVVVWISSTPEGAHDAPGPAEGVPVRDRVRLRADDASFTRFVADPR